MQIIDRNKYKDILTSKELESYKTLKKECLFSNKKLSEFSALEDSIDSKCIIERPCFDTMQIGQQLIIPIASNKSCYGFIETEVLDFRGTFNKLSKEEWKLQVGEATGIMPIGRIILQKSSNEDGIHFFIKDYWEFSTQELVKPIYLFDNFLDFFEKIVLDTNVLQEEILEDTEELEYYKELIELGDVDTIKDNFQNTYLSHYLSTFGLLCNTFEQVIIERL